MEVSTTYRSYRSGLREKPEDISHYKRLAGVSRWTFNWALKHQTERLANEQPLLTVKELYGAFKELKQEQGYEWLKACPCDVPYEAIRNCVRAFQLYENQDRNASNKGYERSLPKRKSRKDGLRYTHSFTAMDNLHERITDKGNHRYTITSNGFTYHLQRKTPFADHGQRELIRIVVQEDHGRWYLTTEFKDVICVGKPRGETVGVDWGFHTMAVSSDGDFYAFKGLTPAEDKRLHTLRVLRLKETPNTPAYSRLQKQIDTLEAKKKNRINDLHHKVANAILKTNLPISERPKRLVIDHLNFTQIADYGGEMRQRIQDEELYQLFLKLRYKADQQGTVFQEVKWYPSSKTCHECGHKNDNLKVSDRTFICPTCGYTQDRDLNAAMNLQEIPEDGKWEALIAKKKEAYRESVADRLAIDQSISKTEEPLGDGFDDWENFDFKQ
jgi:IS605 OrfB family transposase